MNDHLTEEELDMISYGESRTRLDFVNARRRLDYEIRLFEIKIMEDVSSWNL